MLAKFGILPNLFRVCALSPTSLGGLLSLHEANSKAFDAKTRERIAIAVAQVNGCDYCLSAHTYIGTNLAKLTADDAALNRKASSTDAKAAVAVRFAAKVAERRGHVSDDDIGAVKAAGYSEAQVIEIISLVAENVLTISSTTLRKRKSIFRLCAHRKRLKHRPAATVPPAELFAT